MVVGGKVEGRGQGDRSEEMEKARAKRRLIVDTQEHPEDENDRRLEARHVMNREHAGANSTFRLPSFY